MDHASFTEICLHQLKMSGVHQDERLVVLTQGNERLDYADAFMAAARERPEGGARARAAAAAGRSSRRRARPRRGSGQAGAGVS